RSGVAAPVSMYARALLVVPRSMPTTYREFAITNLAQDGCENGDYRILSRTRARRQRPVTPSDFRHAVFRRRRLPGQRRPDDAATGFRPLVGPASWQHARRLELSDRRVPRRRSAG